MNDRELLELAAKAAGFDDASWNAETHCILTAKLSGFRCYWNPLDDDGDALRLAVRLSLFDLNEVLFATGENIADSDPYAATRRAIVRAAAEIGREMK